LEFLSLKKTFGGIGIGIALVLGCGVAFAASTNNAIVPVSATFDLFPTAPVTYGTCVAANGDQFVIQHNQSAGNQTDTSPGTHPVNLSGYLVVVSKAYVDEQPGSPYQGSALVKGKSTLYTDNTQTTVIYQDNFTVNGQIIDQQQDAVARGPINAALSAGGRLIGNQEFSVNGSTGEIQGHFGGADGGTPDFTAETQACS
jgi:hypothetical protein